MANRVFAYLKTTAPTTGDDTSAGYKVGDGWYDTTNDKIYKAIDVTAAAAIWIEIVGRTQTQTLTNKTLTSPVLTTPQINDTSSDHQYIVAVSELTADRTITFPLLTGNDVFVFADFVQTLTNKRITKRVATATDDATAVIDSDSYDEYYLTAIANNTEISVTGTPTAGQEIFIGLKDAGVSKTLTWTGITALGQTLPTATTASKQHIIKIKYIASAWRAIAVEVED